MTLDRRNLVEAVPLTALLLTAALAAGGCSGCTRPADPAGDREAEEALGNSVPMVSETADPAETAAAGEEISAPEPSFAVTLKVAMAEYAFVTEPTIQQHAVFTIPDESGDFGVGFRPERITYDGSSQPVVEIAVLDVRNPGRPGEEQIIPWNRVSLRAGERSTVASPDGEGSLEVSVTTIDTGAAGAS